MATGREPYPPPPPASPPLPFLPRRRQRTRPGKAWLAPAAAGSSPSLRSQDSTRGGVLWLGVAQPPASRRSCSLRQRDGGVKTLSGQIGVDGVEIYTSDLGRLRVAVRSLRCAGRPAKAGLRPTTAAPVGVAALLKESPPQITRLPHRVPGETLDLGYQIER